MVHPVQADLFPLLRHLVEALQPFADAQLVTLRFEANCPEIRTVYHPEKILPDLTQLLCRVVTFTPQEHCVTLHATLLDLPEAFSLQLSVLNTGVSLSYLAEITNGMAQSVEVKALEKPGTAFVWCLPLQRPAQPAGEATEQITPRGSPLLKQFYDEMRKRLGAHFSDPVNLERAVNRQSPREAAFLHKVNAVIQAHLEREHFDVTQLCKSLALSRTQLYRRLVPIIRQSPARYIRLVRLQKAKEMLETGELTIGEIADRTGFQSQSHFTRTFTGHYGVRPSAFQRQQKPKM